MTSSPPGGIDLPIKFVVTGPKRSGTTWLASILNSQPDVACLETDIPQVSFPRRFSSQEEFDCFCAGLDANFIRMGLAPPTGIRGATDREDLIYRFTQHLRETLDIHHLGFKQTMLGRKALKVVTDEGYKVILLARKHEDVLRSWVHRIEPNLSHAQLRLHKWLVDVNWYSLSFLPNDSTLVVDYDFLLNNTGKVLEAISEFLSFQVTMPQVLYHSFARHGTGFHGNTSFPIHHQSSAMRTSLPAQYTDLDFMRAASRLRPGQSHDHLLRAQALLQNYRRLRVRLFS
jgi:hypothetical protein